MAGGGWRVADGGWRQAAIGRRPSAETRVLSADGRLLKAAIRWPLASFLRPPSASRGHELTDSLAIRLFPRGFVLRQRLAHLDARPKRRTIATR